MKRQRYFEIPRDLVGLATPVPMYLIMERNEGTGHYFFSNDAMKDFDSHVGGWGFRVWTSAGELVAFVSSEQFHGWRGEPGQPRQYRVRVMNWESGDIRTLAKDEYGEKKFSTECQAYKCLWAWAKDVAIKPLPCMFGITPVEERCP
jgi:hypothetical protein